MMETTEIQKPGSVFPIAFLVLSALTIGVAGPQNPQGVDAPKSIDTFFGKYCYGCHDAETKKADLNLEGLTRKITNGTAAEHWQDILDKLNAGEMPPKKKKQPSKEELSAAIGDLTNTLFAAQKMLKDSGGAIAVRRLNRREYEATIKDLMGINLDGEKLPSDPSGRFDTIGQNQSLNALQLERYFSFGQEVARMALHWACQPRHKAKVRRKEGANMEAREKEVYEILEKVKLANESGQSHTEVGLTDEQWEKHNRGGAGFRDRSSQAKFYQRNLAYHEKGRMLSHGLLVEHIGVHFLHDARAHYRLRACAGVVDGVKIRRLMRMTIRNGQLNGKHGKAIGSFLVTGTPENPSTHEMEYRPTFPPDFRPEKLGLSFRTVCFLEDKRGGPGFEQFYHHFKPIEPDAPQDTILVKWIEAEGPFYEPRSPFELLVDKYEVATASDETLDLVAKSFLTKFAEVAFRHRGRSDGFIEKLSGYYQKRRRDGLGFREAVIDPLAMILTSTRFLYLLEPSDGTEVRKHSASSVANRLSYFLWSGPPDEALRRLAKTGDLLQPKVLSQQVDRMLGSPRAENFFQGFMAQWMHLKRFDEVGLDSKLLLHRTDGMIHASKREPIEFFKTMVCENLCASNLIDSDFIMANGVLALKYGLSEHYSGDGFKKVHLPPGSPRGGLLTQAAFLSTGTMGNRTSAIIRGSLVKEILLNEPPPPPPPNVPELVAAGTDPLASVRSLVELHQKKAQCASCHARFDFIGLGLENFDAVGLWRDEELVTEAQEAQQIPHRPKKVYPVDASGRLPNGETFDDVHGLKAALMKKKRTVAGSLFEGLLCYALGRNLSFTDRPLIKKTLDDLAAQSPAGDSFAVREMIKRVVTSKPFRER